MAKSKNSTKNLMKLVKDSVPPTMWHFLSIFPMEALLDHVAEIFVSSDNLISKGREIDLFEMQYISFVEWLSEANIHPDGENILLLGDTDDHEGLFTYTALFFEYLSLTLPVTAMKSLPSEFFVQNEQGFWRSFSEFSKDARSVHESLLKWHEYFGLDSKCVDPVVGFIDETRKKFEQIEHFYPSHDEIKVFAVDFFEPITLDVGKEKDIIRVRENAYIDVFTFNVRELLKGFAGISYQSSYQVLSSLNDVKVSFSMIKSTSINQRMSRLKQKSNVEKWHRARYKKIISNLSNKDLAKRLRAKLK